MKCSFEKILDILVYRNSTYCTLNIKLPLDVIQQHKDIYFLHVYRNYFQDRLEVEY